jgi:HSP20 family protein
VDADSLDITIAENVLKLTGSRKPEELKPGEVSHRQERVSGEFTRTFRLPYAVDSGKVDASCEKGILKVRLPRAEADKPKKIAIKSQK